MNNFWNFYKRTKGFMALMSVLIVTAIALMIITSLSISLFDEEAVITDNLNARNAYYLAYSCAEEWLMRIRRDELNYRNGALSIDDQNRCQVEINILGVNLQLIATGESYQSKKEIEVIFTIENEINLLDENNILRNRNNVSILSWREI